MHKVFVIFKFGMILSMFLCSLMLSYREGVAMLREAGVEMGDEDDLR